MSFFDSFTEGIGKLQVSAQSTSSCWTPYFARYLHALAAASSWVDHRIQYAPLRPLSSLLSSTGRPAAATSGCESIQPRWQTDATWV